MKVFVIHDKRGKIEGLAVPGPELAGRIQMAPRKGRQATEVDLPDLEGNVLSSQNQERLLRIIDSFRLAQGPGAPKLVPVRRTAPRARSQSQRRR